VCSATARMLRKCGYDVAMASTGDEAVALARDEPFDILLTDMVMPGLSGRETADEIVRVWPDIQVLFMSGYPASARMPEAQFIAKPFDRRSLLAKLGAARRPA
jgi:CheY-like chemotaxis protein